MRPDPGSSPVRSGTGSGSLLPGPGGRVCVVLLTGIGDVVHGLPVIEALRERRPDLEVTWVAEPAPSEVLRSHPSVDRRVVFRKGDGIRGVAALFRSLRGRGGFDLTLNMQRYFKSLFPTLFSGSPIRIGLPRDKTRDGVSFFNTHHLSDGPWKHTQDLFLDFLDLLGVPRPPELRWRITFDDEEESAARAYFEGWSGAPRIGVVTGTANPEKDWPAERYPPLVDALERDFGYRVFLLGGPGERERATARRTVDEARAEPVWALVDTVRELMWRIRGMDLLVSPDTGPVHLARAMGVPVVGLYGHTNPWRVGPYRAYEDLVVDRYTEADEEPDPARYDPRHGRMERIDVTDVLERVERARRRYGPEAPRRGRAGGSGP